MKRILILVVIISATFFASAQKMEASKVPAAVKASFQKKYPRITPRWEKEGENYEVNFKQNNNPMSVIIEPNGNILETEMDIKTNELPAIVLTYVKEQYKGKTIKEAARTIKADGTVTYEAEVAGTDIIFDANGKFIKEVKEKKDKDDNDD